MSAGGGGSSSSSSFGPTPGAVQALIEGSMFAGELANITAGMYDSVVVGNMLPLMFGISDPNLAIQGSSFGRFPEFVGTDPSGFGANYVPKSPWEQSGGVGGTSVRGGGGGGGGVDPFARFGAPGMIMEQAFDPEKALYNQQLGQLQQQMGTELASSGLGSSPYGAAAMGNALANFNIDWQNNLLNREITGAEGAMGIYSGALGGASTSAQPMSSGTSALAQMAQQQQGQSQSSSSNINAGK